MLVTPMEVILRENLTLETIPVTNSCVSTEPEIEEDSNAGNCVNDDIVPPN